jgi:putative sigma-54 modulation protein
MPVVVTARHMDDVSATVQDYAKSKGEELVSAFAKVEHVHIILNREKHLNRAEVVVQAKNHNRVEAEHVSENLRTSIDAAFDRAERQLRKFQDKVRERRPKSEARGSKGAGAAATEADQE